ncbi:MAG: PASTA domain-containing protein [Selenomonadaceae bacterium]|nr:PASTA domain-containing protein [Selenomonadaceae bacterium]
MAHDVVGRPWEEAKALLESAGIGFQTEISRPSRDFFKTDRNCLYVVRERRIADGTLLITLVAKQKKLEKEVF